MRKLLAAAAALTVLALTGCASSTPTATHSTASADKKATPTATATNVKYFAYHGAKGRVALAGDPSNETVKDVEAYRAKVGGPETRYVVVHTDNSKGTVDLGIYALEWVAKDGSQHHLDESLSDRVSSWPVPDQGAKVDMYNKYLKANDVMPGAVQETVIPGDEDDPTDFKNGWLYVVGGMDKTQLYDSQKQADDAAKAEPTDAPTDND